MRTRIALVRLLFTVESNMNLSDQTVMRSCKVFSNVRWERTPPGGGKHLETEARSAEKDETIKYHMTGSMWTAANWWRKLKLGLAVGPSIAGNHHIRGQKNFMKLFRSSHMKKTKETKETAIFI